MTGSSTRRSVLGGLATLPLLHHGAWAADDPFAALERRHGGRLGVAVLDTGSGAWRKYRADERFPFCSTFKVILVGAVLARVDRGEERLDRRIGYSVADLLEYAPVTKEHVDGGMTVAELCAAAIQWSDNTAANLLLKSVGGPHRLTRYARTLGDTVFRLDRDEPTLNTAIPGDKRDTGSPRMMARDLSLLLLGNRLRPDSHRHLEDWMIGDKVGDQRLRAGLPAGWRIGDKTGTGDNGTTNDLAIIWPPGRKPLIVAVYYTGSTASAEARNGVIADVGRIVAGA